LARNAGRDLENAQSHCRHRTVVEIIIPFSWALNINAWDGNCLLAINAQYLKKMWTLRNRKPVKALHLRASCCEVCDSDLKRASPGLPFSEKKSIDISLAIYSCN